MPSSNVRNKVIRELVHHMVSRVAQIGRGLKEFIFINDGVNLWYILLISSTMALLIFILL